MGLLKRIFGKKNKQNEFIVEPPKEEVKNEIVNEDKESSSIIEDEIIQISGLTEEDVEYVVNRIRPIVRDTNTDELYGQVSRNIGSKKTLKTYKELSINKFLYVTFTQNKEFNEKLNNYIEHNMLEKITKAVNENPDRKYDVCLDNGSIIISRIERK